MGLRINIEGLRFRVSDGKLSAPAQSEIIRKRLSNSEKRLRAGDNPANLAKILGKRQPLGLKISEAIDLKANLRQLEIPPMLDVPGKPFRIMKTEVTVGQFNQFVAATGYKIAGPHAEELQAKLGGAPEDCLTYLSLQDGRAFSNWLSEQTGKNWRIPTENELVSAGLVWDQLSGHKWEWTESKDGNRAYIHLSLINPPQWSFNEDRDGNFAVRLVEDKKMDEEVSPIKTNSFERKKPPVRTFSLANIKMALGIKPAVISQLSDLGEIMRIEVGNKKFEVVLGLEGINKRVRKIVDTEVGRTAASSLVNKQGMVAAIAHPLYSQKIVEVINKETGFGLSMLDYHSDLEIIKAIMQKGGTKLRSKGLEGFWTSTLANEDHGYYYYCHINESGSLEVEEIYPHISWTDGVVLKREI